VHLADDDVGGHRGCVLQHPDHGRLGLLAFALEGDHLILSVLSGQRISNSSAVWAAKRRRHMLRIVVQLTILR
jgi:hypothetical protein